MASTLSIFLVDDDEDDIAFFREAIRELNVACWIRRFADGREILDYFASGGKAPSMMVLDINLPFFDGISVLKKMHDDHELSKIPVFILSTSKEDGHRQKCKELGCRSYYVKPAKMSDYQLIIEDMLTHFSI